MDKILADNLFGFLAFITYIRLNKLKNLLLYFTNRNLQTFTDLLYHLLYLLIFGLHLIQN